MAVEEIFHVGLNDPFCTKLRASSAVVHWFDAEFCFDVFRFAFYFLVSNM